MVIVVQPVKTIAYVHLTKPYFTPQMSYAIIMMLLRFKIIFQEDLHMANRIRNERLEIKLTQEEKTLFEEKRKLAKCKILLNNR